MSTETLTFTVDGSSKSIPITVSPASGTLKYSATGASRIAESTGAAFPVICDWHQFPTVAQTNPEDGNKFAVDQNDHWHYWCTLNFGVVVGGRACLEMIVEDLTNVPPSPTGGRMFGCVKVGCGSMGGLSWDQLGPYLAGRMYVPAGGLTIPGPTRVINFGELNYGGRSSAANNIHQAPWTFSLYPDRLELTGLCGTYSTTAGYEYSGPQTLVHVIPSGAFAASTGQWYEYVVRLVWASDGTGEVETWWRLEGGPWQQAVTGTQYSGKPTYVWAADVPAPAPGSHPANCAPFFNYQGGAPVGAGPTILHRQGWHVGTTFQTVVAALALT